MKEYGGMELQHHSFLTLALGAGKLSASCPGQFTIKEKSPQDPLNGRHDWPHSWSRCFHEDKWILDLSGIKT